MECVGTLGADFDGEFDKDLRDVAILAAVEVGMEDIAATKGEVAEVNFTAEECVLVGVVGDAMVVEDADENFVIGAQGDNVVKVDVLAGRLQTSLERGKYYRAKILGLSTVLKATVLDVTLDMSPGKDLNIAAQEGANDLNEVKIDISAPSTSKTKKLIWNASRAPKMTPSGRQRTTGSLSTCCSHVSCVSTSFV